MSNPFHPYILLTMEVVGIHASGEVVVEWLSGSDGKIGGLGFDPVCLIVVSIALMARSNARLATSTVSM